ncbi:hypothetical protein C4J83_0239 [Pseudomonas sp. LBUM920]|nr:hypothetical protein C4J83_0239 [Pseudomonas sp. LBUM920]
MREVNRSAISTLSTAQKWNAVKNVAACLLANAVGQQHIQ